MTERALYQAMLDGFNRVLAAEFAEETAMREEIMRRGLDWAAAEIVMLRKLVEGLRNKAPGAAR